DEQDLPHPPQRAAPRVVCGRDVRDVEDPFVADGERPRLERGDDLRLERLPDLGRRRDRDLVVLADRRRLVTCGSTGGEGGERDEPARVASGESAFHDRHLPRWRAGIPDGKAVSCLPSGRPSTGAPAARRQPRPAGAATRGSAGRARSARGRPNATLPASASAFATATASSEPAKPGFTAIR